MSPFHMAEGVGIGDREVYCEWKRWMCVESIVLRLTRITMQSRQPPRRNRRAGIDISLLSG